jgi:hypothetical protein
MVSFQKASYRASSFTSACHRTIRVGPSGILPEPQPVPSDQHLRVELINIPIIGAIKWKERPARSLKAPLYIYDHGKGSWHGFTILSGIYYRNINNCLITAKW